MADMQLHRATFYEMGDHTRADLWISDNAVTDKATQVVALQVNVTTIGRPHRRAEAPRPHRRPRRHRLRHRELERVRSRIR